MNSITTQDTIVNALSGAKDAVVNTISQAAQTVYPTQPTNSTPSPPRGVPPSEECSLGKVAYEDKTLSGKLSENIENIQTGFTSLRRPSLEALIDLQNEGLPQPPRGVPPSDDSRGFVSNQDKTYLTRVSENLPTIPALPQWVDYRQEINAFYTTFPQNLTDTVNQAKATIGLAPSSGPVTVPNPPRGIPPSDADSGFVANSDKPIQLQLEENWEMLRGEFLSLWTQSKRKLGWNWIQPGSVPEPPRGLAPSDENSNGVVSDRDKTLVKNIDDVVTQFRDVAQKTVDDTVGYVRTMGTGQQTTQPQNESGAPNPPHGIPPSEGLTLGIVSEQDKTIQQKVGDAWQQVKGVVNNAMTDKPYNYTIGNPQSVITDGEM